MKSCKIQIKGMHCHSCELLIESELLKVPGVKKAIANQSQGTAEIHYKDGLDHELVKKVIHAAGYELGVDKKLIFSKNPKDYRDLGVSLFIVLDLFFIAKILGINNLNFASSNNFGSLPIVFLIGLTAGVSTCMALVGGLILGASARFAEKHPQSTPLQKFKPHLFFNAGRIISYTILGAIIGYLGSVFQLSSSFFGLLTIVVGVVMLLLGTQLIEIFPVLRNVNFTLPKSISRILGIKERSEKEYSHTNSALAGAMTFFLPCGFTQAIQLYAISTGNPITAALTLGTFALGTAPGLLGIGGLTSVIKGTAAKLFFKSAGVVVIALAIFNLSNGYNLTGNTVGGALSLLYPLFPRTTASASVNSGEADDIQIENGIVIIKMNQNANGYEPNVFTIKRGIPVRWIINSKSSFSCATSLIAPKLNIRKNLSPGENIIEFTPQEEGSIRFSCSMGMYRGTFNVIKNDTTDYRTSRVSPADATTTQGVSVPNQIFKLTYNRTSDITPKQISIPVGKPVRIEIEAQDDGSGCMSSVTIPGLTEKIDLLEKGQTNIFDVTAVRSGTYYITCGMGTPRVQISAL